MFEIRSGQLAPPAARAQWQHYLQGQSPGTVRTCWYVALLLLVGDFFCFRDAVGLPVRISYDELHFPASRAVGGTLAAHGFGRRHTAEREERSPRGPFFVAGRKAALVASDSVGGNRRQEESRAMNAVKVACHRLRGRYHNPPFSVVGRDQRDQSTTPRPATGGTRNDIDKADSRKMN